MKRTKNSDQDVIKDIVRFVIVIALGMTIGITSVLLLRGPILDLVFQP